MPQLRVMNLKASESTTTGVAYPIGTSCRCKASSACKDTFLLVTRSCENEVHDIVLVLSRSSCGLCSSYGAVAIQTSILIVAKSGLRPMTSVSLCSFTCATRSDDRRRFHTAVSGSYSVAACDLRAYATARPAQFERWMNDR